MVTWCCNSAQHWGRTSTLGRPAVAVLDQPLAPANPLDWSLRAGIARLERQGAAERRQRRAGLALGKLFLAEEQAARHQPLAHLARVLLGVLDEGGKLSERIVEPGLAGQGAQRGLDLAGVLVAVGRIVLQAAGDDARLRVAQRGADEARVLPLAFEDVAQKRGR